MVGHLGWVDLPRSPGIVCSWLPALPCRQECRQVLCAKFQKEKFCLSIVQVFHSYLLHQSPQPLDQLWLVVAVVPGPVERRRGDHEPRGPVPDEGHGVLLDHVDEVGDVLVGSLHADVVHEALERGQPDVDELGSNSIEKFWLEFWPEKSLEFWLEIPYTKKKFKNG